MAQGKNPFESDKPVYFNLGDTGEKVSNDPRYFDAQYMEKALKEIENTGRATRNEDELAAELGTGSPVGSMTGAEVAPPATPVRLVQDQAPATQEDELLEKDEADMSVQELKAHVKELEAAGVEVDTAGITKKSELVKAVKKAKKAAAKNNEE